MVVADEVGQGVFEGEGAGQMDGVEGTERIRPKGPGDVEDSVGHSKKVNSV